MRLLLPSSFYERDFIPAIEGGEDDKNVYVSAEVAGVDKKDVHIEYKDQILTISGEREEKKETADYSEFSRGKFSRKLTVGDVDFDHASAKMENGILKITLPKSEEVQARELEIK